MMYGLHQEMWGGKRLLKYYLIMGFIKKQTRFECMKKVLFIEIRYQCTYLIGWLLLTI